MENIEHLVPLLDKLASQLGTTSKYLWKVLIRQAPISGILDILQYILIVIMIWGSYYTYSWAHKMVEDKDWDETTYAWPVITGLITVIFLITAFFSFPNTITKFINPEYWALKEIIGSAK